MNHSLQQIKKQDHLQSRNDAAFVVTSKKQRTPVEQ